MDGAYPSVPDLTPTPYDPRARWTDALLIVGHNAVRREAVDLYTMVAAAAAATPHPSAAVPNADILAAWFPPFYALVSAELDLDDTVLFTFLEGQDAPLPPALSAAGRERLRGGTAAARKRLLFAGSMGELAAAVDDLVPPLLSYYTAAEAAVPDALEGAAAGLGAARE